MNWCRLIWTIVVELCVYQVFNSSYHAYIAIQGYSLDRSYNNLVAKYIMLNWLIYKITDELVLQRCCD